jgi:5-formyltetrahydrofolate cyclo-ligase
MGKDRKQELRERAWSALQHAGAARFPGVRGRIPNFVGAETAAEQLREAPEWREARVLKCNPDLPQRPVRHAALREGKRVYVAVPRLAEESPFLELDPRRIPESKLWEASSIRGASALAEPVALERMPAIDLIVCGCVAVTPEGARLGKGEGYSDLEYALLAELGCAHARTPIATTVHPAQFLPSGSIPMTPTDISLDLIATPDRLWRPSGGFPRPSGVDWPSLSEEKRRAIPVLRARS